MVIQHNLSAYNAHRNLGLNNKSISTSLEKLSSGFRINRAADDAAGLAISEKMRGQIRGTLMGTQNVDMGVKLVQTAEGALNESHAILQRMRELAVQSANGTYDDKVDRNGIQKEYKALTNELTRIAKSTHYNGIKLLDGSQSSVPALVPASSTDPEAAMIYFDDMEAEGYPTGSNNAIGMNLANLFGFDTNVEESAGGIWFQTYVGDATYDLIIGKDANGTPKLSIDWNGTIYESTFGFNDASFSSPFEGYFFKDSSGTEVFFIGIACVDGGSARSSAVADGYGTGTIYNVKVTSDMSNHSPYGSYGALYRSTYDGDTFGSLGNDKQVPGQPLLDSYVYAKMQASDGMTIHHGANSNDNLLMYISNMGASALGVGGTALTTRESANNAIPRIDNAINRVSSERAGLGAFQNRLESIIRNNGVKAENLQAAESSIRDVDMAEEMMKFTKDNIIAQAAQSMLAQANQLPQGVLRLLNA